MKIDCLMGTYGRYTFACDALACFLAQTALQEATLLIYNQHPVPLKFSHPRVRVVNVVNPPGTTLRDIRAQMIALANPDAEFVHLWDDDDLYLPWHLEDCLSKINDHKAWKPNSSWILKGDRTYELATNMYEGSWIFRAEYLGASPADTHPDYPDLPVFMQSIDNNLLASTELNGRSNYIYRWGHGQTNHSSLGAQGSDEKQRQVMRYLHSVSKDVRDDGELVASDLTEVWQHYLAGTKALVTPEEWAANKKAVGLPEFALSPRAPELRPHSGLMQRLNPFRSKR